jgi:hypothetical protein
MRENQVRVAIFAVVVTVFGTLSSADAAPAPACEKIASACEAAGFVRGGARTGNGLHRDCIAPIMHGSSLPPRQGTKPLPHIAGSLVADCKAERKAERDNLLGEVMQIAQPFIGRLMGD